MPNKNSANSSLGIARVAKKDEFYTQLSDIEKELHNYRQHFKDKTVLCNCDDPFESNFFKYFVLNFNRLELKKLIATSYVSSPIAGSQFGYYFGENGQMQFLFGDENKQSNRGRHPYKAIVTSVHDATGNGGVEMEDIANLFKLGENTLEVLDGDGDFRSSECLELLDEADIVATNPPFSLFREYLATLIEHEKEFVIIGNQNVITYKEVFPLLKDNKIWLGYHSGHTLFEVPDTYDIPDFYNIEDRQRLRSNGYIFDDNGKLWRNLGNICWLTNLDIKKRHEKIILVRRYSPELYPKYDNYDAINVDKVIDIPCDYSGIMGVPISFIEKYCPEQFEIIWQASGNSYANAPKEVLEMLKFDPTVKYGGGLGAGVVDGKAKYARIMVRNKHPEQPKGV